jgi:AraC-like DNA-binding protein
LRRIQNEFNTRLSAEVLAEETCMCLTSFHESFRAVTGTTPLQYLKTLRLNTARILMVRDGISAAAAAGRVGYESPSQFSREFKRQFGNTPAQLARGSGAPASGSSSEATAEQPARSRRLDPRSGGAAATQVPAALGNGSQGEKRFPARLPVVRTTIPSAELHGGSPDRMSCLQSSTRRGL